MIKLGPGFLKLITILWLRPEFRNPDNSALVTARVRNSDNSALVGVRVPNSDNN